MDFLQYCFIFFATMFAVGMVRIFMEALDGVLVSIIGVLGTLICTNSDTITTNQTESCGKNCTRDVSITVESSK